MSLHYYSMVGSSNTLYRQFCNSQVLQHTGSHPPGQSSAVLLQQIDRMGNCNQNFQNVHQDNDLFAPTHKPISPHIPAAHQQLRPDHPPLHLIDEQTLQPAFPRQLQPPLKLTEPKSDTPVLFPDPTSAYQQPEPLQVSVKKTRPKLEELDLSFYHQLALPDYEYRAIPEQERHLFAKVQTYEMKDNYGVKYLGEWLNNSIHGNGVLMSNTAKYIGQFKHGLKHYHGREILTNEVYEGSFEGGRRKGEGVRYTPALTEVGLFDQELLKGKIMHLDGRQEYKLQAEYMQIEEDDPLADMAAPVEQPPLEIYTEKYYEQSELPPEWEDDEMPNLNRFSK